MGYTKLFDSMWSGSLYGKFEASAVFMVMLSLADAEGQVDMTHEAIAGRTGWPIDFIREGIRQLEQPDERSRTPDADGRRIIQITEGRGWGWFITNYHKYREEMRSAERREYLREAKKRERDKRRQQMSTGQPVSTEVNPSYAEAEQNNSKSAPGPKKARRRAQEGTPEPPKPRVSGHGPEPIYVMLAASNGALPSPRSPATQYALEQIGGWQRIQGRGPTTEDQIRREFCEAYKRFTPAHQDPAVPARPAVASDGPRHFP
jgi:hypothetical protein